MKSSFLKLKSGLFVLAFLMSLSAYSTDLYWIGGTGNWNDATHWSTTSGGGAGAVTPTLSDNVFFDINSFTAPGQTVTVNATANCLDMDWTGATNNPQLYSANQDLNIYGSVTLIPAMSVNIFHLYFKSTSAGKTITTAGVTIQQLGYTYFDGIGGSWSFQDAFTSSSQVNLLNGTLNTNNQAFTCLVFNSTNSNVRALNLGSSIVTITGTSFDMVGANATVTAGTSVVNMTGSATSTFHGGSQSFNDINWTNISGNGSLFGGVSYNKITYANTGDVTPQSGTFYASMSFPKMAYINPGNGNFGKVTFLDNGNISDNNSFDSLIFSAGRTYQLQAGKTQSVSSYFGSLGTCSQAVNLKSNATGNASFISSSTATVNVNYTRILDVHATGGASFIASNSINIGNTTGWTINAPAAQDLYWIGGTGNWNDPTHWSNTSGGAPGTCVPSRFDNVHFDANSFTAGSKIVTVNVNAECDSMIWTGASNSPILNGSTDLSIFGSLRLIAAMTNSFTGKLIFASTGAGNRIASAGKSFSNRVTFDGANGDWTLEDNFTITGTSGDLYLNNGFLVTNDKTVSCYGFNSTTTTSRGLYLGNSTINVSAPWQAINSWEVSGSNFFIDAGTSTIKLIAAMNTDFYGGAGNYYYDVVFQDATTFIGTLQNGAGFHHVSFNANGNIYTPSATMDKITVAKDANIYGALNSIIKAVFLGNATINEITSFDTLSLAGGKVYNFFSGKTQTVSHIQTNGTCSNPVVMQSTTLGTAATISSSSNITVSSVQMRDITAIGGGTFIANGSINLGNNNGWTFNASPSLNLYWVGGSGNWNDPNHWSLTQGGAGGACVPTQVDDVFFTTGSFTAGSKIVTINVAAYCKNMNWTGAGFTPVLTGTSSLNVYGSLTLISAMTSTGFSGTLNFNATTTGNTITSAGKTFSGDVYFDGTGGYWTLQDAFNTTTKNIYLKRGTLNTNGKTVSCFDFYSNFTFPTQLILGSSTVNIAGTNWATTSANYIVNAGTSKIMLNNNTGSPYFDGGVNSSYYDINFNGASQLGELVSGNSFRNVTFNGSGRISIAAGGTFKKAEFKTGTNHFNYDNSFDSLLIGSGTTNNFMQARTQTINKYFKADGTAGNLTILTSSFSNTYSISITACNVCANYLDIKNCNAVGGASFYADNSTNSGNNTGWNFGSCPSTTLSVGPITGVTNTCANGTGYTYSIPAIAGATYTWTVPGGNTITSGQGSASIQVDMVGTAGTISVTASACGTSNSATKTITVNPVPVISSVNVTPPTSCIIPDGSATATITSGSSPFDYQWSSGDSLATADSLYSGQYQLTVSDLYGCLTSTVVTINSVGGPTVTLGSSANVTCPGGNNGSLTGNVTGGITPYTYAWTSGATTATANNLQAGTYVLTVTDSAGCQVVANYTVTQPSPLSLVINTSPSSCSGTSGSATVVASGGTAGYTYLWSSNAASQTTATATALAAGLYTVTVTDNAGCTSSGSAMVSTNTAGASISLDNITAGTCGTSGPGTIDITTSGGATPYTYSWSNGASTEDITGASPGTYSLGVIDGNGCMTFTTYIVPNANPGYQPQICVVTFDTITNSNLVAWEKTGAVGIASYNIYCEIGSFNNYQLVGNVPATSLSEFVHPGANADVKSWKYKISAIDSCGTETPLSSYHKTIHLQISQNGSVNNLSWDNYFGFNYGSFEVWRHTPTTNWQMLSSIAFCGFTVCQNGYTDFAPVPGDTNRYAILVNAPQACVTTARLANGSDIQGSIVKTRSNVKNNRTSGIGIAETSLKNNYEVYPNPTSKEITVQLNKNCVNCDLEITNALGQTLRTEKLLSLDNKINVSGLANGVYYLKIKNANAQDVQKLIIQH